MRSRVLNYANVMATVAVFVALGGGAYAAKVAKNSVGAPQIKKNAVKSSEIKKNAVGASEIAAGAVGAEETAAGSVGSAEVVDGSLFGVDLAANSITGAAVNEATLFNDNSLNGADINEAALTGVPLVTGGQGTIPTGSDTIQLAGGSLTYGCGNPSTYVNESGDAARMIATTGAHVGAAQGMNEVVFATPTPVNDGDIANFAFPNDWIQGAIITDDHVATFEIWQDLDGPSCFYVMSVNEVPR